MAARFAVTTGDWTDAIWAATVGGAAGSAAVPTSADDATINNGVTVTVDDLSPICNSLTISNGGYIQPSQVAHNRLTVQLGITMGSGASPVSNFIYDMSAVPEYTAEVRMAGVGAPSGAGYVLNAAGNFKMKGAEKTKYSYTDGALTGQSSTSIPVDDATGWKVGDKLVFAATQAHENTALTITAASYSSPYITFTVASSAGLVPGRELVFSGMQANLNSRHWPVFDVPGGGTTFRVDVGAGFTLTDGVGTALFLPKSDLVTIDTITFDNAPTNTGRATITWADGRGAGGSVAHDHADNCIVGNFTRNVVFGPVNPYDVVSIQLNMAGRSADGRIDDVMFDRCRMTSNFPAGIIQGAGATSFASGSNNAFFDIAGVSGQSGVWALHNGFARQFTRDSNLYYLWPSLTSVYASAATQSSDIGPDTNSLVLRSDSGIWLNWPGAYAVNPMISGCMLPSSTASLAGGGVDANAPVVFGGGIWACNSGVGGGNGPALYDGLRLGIGPNAGAVYNAANLSDVRINSSQFATLRSCPENGAGLSIISFSSTAGQLRVFNRNVDSAVQEIYKFSSYTVPAMARDASVANRANASLRMEWASTWNNVNEWPFQVLAKSGTPIKIIVFMRKNSSYGSTNLPSITVSGLGITPVSATMTDVNDTWEKHELTVTQSSGSDGLLDVILRGQSAVNGGKCWFSGLPIAPFASRCRHYGYLFDETSPTRTVDSLTEDDEDTAALLTGMSFDWDVAQTDVTISEDVTFQELFDHHQSQAVLHPSDAIALTGAGVAGSPSLFANADIDITTGDKLNGSGSIGMGAFTLTTEFAGAVPYTYTGGTWSQATTIPSFSGGVVAIGAAGAFEFTASNINITATPTDTTDYDLSDCTFSGSNLFWNTSAHNINVSIPSGAVFSSAGSPGAGTVTFIAPIVSADISITGMTTAAGAERRLQVVNATALTAAARANSTAYAVGDIRLRETGIGTENTAGLYLRCTTAGTSDAAPPTWNTTPGGTTTDGTAVWTTYSVLFYDDDPAAATLTDTYIDGEEFKAGETVRIRFAEMDGSTSFKTYGASAIATADGFSALVSVTPENTYALNALDGSAYEATYSPNFTSNYIVLDTNTDFAGKSAFAYFCYTLTTSNGMHRFWGGVTALDEGNYRINTDVLNLFFDESAGFVKQTDNVRIFRSDGARPALDPTTGGNGIEMNWRVPVNVTTVTGGNVVTGDVSEVTTLINGLLTGIDGLNQKQAMRLLLAAMAGKMDGADINQPRFRDINDTKDRIAAITDAVGNRLSVTVDPD